MENTGKKANLTDTLEGTCLTFPQFGDGKFLIGLSLDDKLTIVNWIDREKDRTVVVQLFSVEQTVDKAYAISPVNKDLPCFVNRVKVDVAAKLPKDCKLEIGDKILRFNDGTRKPRKLPPTPGVMVLSSAPPKPTRLNGSLERLDEELDKEEHEIEAEMLGGDVTSPGVEYDVIHGVVEHPDQISSVAASHVVRQMMMYTDLKMSVTMMDELYKAFQDVVSTNRSLLLDFLQETKREMDLQKRGRLSGDMYSQPLHGPVINLLVELLKHSLDPVSHVILWLQFLRTLSHFTQNFGTMVSCQAAAAIMGSMAAFLEVPEVQQYGLEVLAKLATYRPQLNEKTPVRETGVEMIVRAMKYHDGSPTILRPACRALANLALTMLGLTSNLPNPVTEADFSASEEAKHRFENIMSNIRETGIPAVRDAMSVYPRDLGIQTESKRLIAILLPESQARHSIQSDDSSGSFVDDDRDLGDFVDIDRLSAVQGDSAGGILKCARSFENLRSADKRVQFSHDTFGGSISAQSDFLESWESSSSRSEFQDSWESLCSPTESRHFLDSFGNEMDVAEPASYIGSDPPSCSTFVSDSHISQPETTDSPETIQEFREKGNGITQVPTSSSSISEDATNRILAHMDEDTSRRTGSSEAKPNDRSCDIEQANLNKFESILMAVDSPRGKGLEDSGDSLLSTIEEASIEGSQDDSSRKTNLQAAQETPIPAARNSKMATEVQVAPLVPPRCLFKEATEAQITCERTAADAQFLTKLIRTVITRHICSLVLGGQDSQALQAIDQPIESLLSSANAHEFLKTYVASEYQSKKSLMDIDPAMVISIIDAVRYKSLTSDLMKSSLTELIGQISDNLDHEVSACALASIYFAIADDNLESVFAEKKFIRQMMKSFPKLADGFLKEKMEELEGTLTDLL